MGELSRNFDSDQNDYSSDDLLDQAFIAVDSPQQSSSKRIKLSEMSDQNKRKLDSQYHNGNRRHQRDDDVLDDFPAGPSNATRGSKITPPERYQKKPARVRNDARGSKSSQDGVTNGEASCSTTIAKPKTERPRFKTVKTLETGRRRFSRDVVPGSSGNSSNNIAKPEENEPALMDDAIVLSPPPLSVQTRNAAAANPFNFRRDDPGRRPFLRPQGVTTRAARGQPTSPQRTQNTRHFGSRNTSNSRTSRNLIQRFPDTFDAEESNEESDLQPASSQSDSDSRINPAYLLPSTRLQPIVSTDWLSAPSTRQASRSNYRNRAPVIDSSSGTADSGNSQNTEEENQVNRFPILSPIRLTPRRAHLATGDNRRHSRGRRRTLSVPESRVIRSPDSIARVQQLEEDERFARSLQAQFDAEVVPASANVVEELIDLENSDDDASNLQIQVVLRDPRGGVELEESTTTSDGSNTSSSSNDHLTAPYMPPVTRQRTALGSARFVRNGRSARQPEGVTQHVHHHHLGGHQPARVGVRNRRGIRNRVNSDPVDPLTFHFNRLIQWTIGLDVGGRHDGYGANDDYDMLWNIAETLGDAVPRGLDRHEINRLPTRKFSTHGSNEITAGPSSSSTSGDTGSNNNAESRLQGNKECQVCLSEFTNGEQLRILPCFHDFHSACIDRWLKKNNTCPVCRAEVKFE